MYNLIKKYFLLVFLILLMVGCTNNSKTRTGNVFISSNSEGSFASNSDRTNYDNIILNEFSVRTFDGGDLSYALTFLDTQTGQPATLDGTVTLKLITDTEDIAYEKTFSLSKRDFTTCKREFSGEDIGSCVLNYITSDEVNSSGESGKATIEISLPNGRIIKGEDNYVNLPKTVR